MEKMILNIGDEYSYKKYTEDNFYFVYNIKVIDTNLCKVSINIFNYEKLENGDEKIIDSEWLCDFEAKNDVSENILVKAKMLGTSTFRADKLPEFIVVNEYCRVKSEDTKLVFDINVIDNLFESLDIIEYDDEYMNIHGKDVCTGCK